MDDCILIRGTREHNLQGIDLDTPRNWLVVVTGLWLLGVALVLRAAGPREAGAARRGRDRWAVSCPRQ